MKKYFPVLIFLFFCNRTFAQWTVINPNNPKNICRQTTFTIGDTAYMGNGDTAFFQYSRAFWGYTTKSNTWNKVRTYPGGGGDMGFSFVINNQGYVGGGANPGYQSDFFQYDPVAGWTSKGSAPGGFPRAFSVGFSIGNKGYAGTGSKSGTPTNDFWEYDPSNGPNGTWTAKKTFPGTPRYGCAAFAINGKGYLGFGCNNTPGLTFKDIYEYDPITDNWREMAPMPTTFGQEEPAYFVVCGKLIITLGDTAHTARDATVQTWVFDPSDGLIGKWYRLPDFTGTPAYSTQGIVLQDTAYLIGGYIDAGHIYLSQMWRYLPKLDPLSVSSGVTICSGTSAVLQADGSSAYKWSPAISLSDSVTNSSSISGALTKVTASPTVTTTYTITEAVCNSQATVTVTVVSAPIAMAIANPSVICAGQSSVLTGAGAAAYTWKSSSGLNITGSTVNVNPTVTTTYTMVASSGGSCIDSSEVIVEVTGNIFQAGTITAVRDTICSGTAGILSVTGSIGSLQWQSSMTGAGFISTGDTGISIIHLPTQTTYYRTVAGNGFCADTSSAFKLIVAPSPIANYDYIRNGLTVIFADKSQGGTIYNWDFGDGQTSSVQNPSHLFSVTDTFHVCLTVFNGSNCSFTICRDIDLISGIETIRNHSEWKIYPSPFSDFILIEAENQREKIELIEIYDVLGRMVMNKNISTPTGNSYKIEVPDLLRGVYCLRIKSDKSEYRTTLMKSE